MNTVFVEVSDRKGRLHTVPASSGSSLMEALKLAGLPVAATCSGAKSCATCHVWVTEGQGRVGIPDDDEIDLLSESTHYRPTQSRLSCQISVHQGLNGLQVILAPEG